MKSYIAAILITCLLCGTAMAGGLWEGDYTVKVIGTNHYLDSTPALRDIKDTTTMKITQNGNMVSVTFGTFAGAMATTTFAGKVGNEQICANWTHAPYPHELEVLWGSRSSNGVIRGQLMYPRTADRPGFVPGWVHISWTATPRKALTYKPVKPAGKLVKPAGVVRRPVQVQGMVKPQAIASGTGTRPQDATSISKPSTKGKISVLYPKGGEELEAGKQYRIRWGSEGNIEKVDVTLFMEDFFMKSMGRSMGLIPVYRIARQIKNTGYCNFKIPYKFTSRFGKRYFVMVGDGKSTGWGNYFSIYPLIDVAPTNIKVYSYEKKKKLPWGLRALAAVVTGGASEVVNAAANSREVAAVVTGGASEAARFAANNRAVAAVATGGATEAARKLAENRTVGAAASGGATEAVRWVADKGRKITKNTRIKIEFDLINYGTKILRRKFMTKVSVRLRPGNDELSAVGFSHDKIIPIIPGKLYHYEADIKPSDWNMLPGKYSLELYTDPGHILAEPAELQNNNKKIVDFEVGK